MGFDAVARMLHSRLSISPDGCLSFWSGSRFDTRSFMTEKSINCRCPSMTNACRPASTSYRVNAGTRSVGAPFSGLACTIDVCRNTYLNPFI
jgi:hypothetical protein